MIVSDVDLELHARRAARRHRAERRRQVDAAAPALGRHPADGRHRRARRARRHPARRSPRRARAGLGRTFQTSSLFDGLSATENVRLSVQSRGRAPLSVLRRAGSRRSAAEVASAARAGADDPPGRTHRGRAVPRRPAQARGGGRAGAAAGRAAARRADGRRLDGGRARPGRPGREPGRRRRHGRDGRAPHGRRARPGRPGRGAAPRPAARGRHARPRSPPTRPCSRRTWGRGCERRARRSTECSEVDRPARAPGPLAHPAGRRLRRAPPAASPRCSAATASARPPP